jgi:hypothetical protein
MDDVRGAPVAADHGVVHGAPVALLEAASVGRAAAHVVLLHGHRVGSLLGEDPAERRAQVRDARGLGVVRGVGDHIEETATEDPLSHGHGRAEVGVVHGDDLQVGLQHEDAVGRCLEEGAEIGEHQRGVHGAPGSDG